MMRGLLLGAALLAGAVWLLNYLLQGEGSTVLAWNGEIYTLPTATLLLGLLATCLLSYLLLWSVLQLLGLRKRLQRVRERHLTTKAARNLTQGMHQLAEGHWEKAENLLTADVERSETPLLNYLAAARAAHMLRQPERRDEWLRQAIASDGKAQVAVGVSQAEMQLADGQLEQAHAALLSLRGLAPQNAYMLKLYAKTLYQQQNWDELLQLLPELLQQGLLAAGSGNANMRKIQAAALEGAFNQYAERLEAGKLQRLWKYIPEPLQAEPATYRRYARALHQAQADARCAQFIVQVQQTRHDDELTDLYGRLAHRDLDGAVQQAEQWLQARPDNPANLLLVARLYQHQQRWAPARAHYIASLQQAPDSEAYLELAELLEQQNETAAAQQCYRTGLRFSVCRRGERLELPLA
ncbi:MAG: heme biosynthesis HemY N-terminal domain-containing protein [Thiolinea sp.]